MLLVICNSHSIQFMQHNTHTAETRTLQKCSYSSVKISFYWSCQDFWYNSSRVRIYVRIFLPNRASTFIIFLQDKNKINSINVLISTLWLGEIINEDFSSLLIMDSCILLKPLYHLLPDWHCPFQLIYGKLYCMQWLRSMWRRHCNEDTDLRYWTIAKFVLDIDHCNIPLAPYLSFVTLIFQFDFDSQVQVRQTGKNREVLFSHTFVHISRIQLIAISE